MKEQYFYAIVIAAVFLSQVCLTTYAVVMWKRWEDAYNSMVKQLNDGSTKKTVVVEMFHAPRSDRMNLANTMVRPV